MCGIVGYLSHEEKPVVSIYQGLKKLEYRGYDSWGIVYLKNKRLVAIKEIGKLKSEPTNLPESVLALGHTRWATHGGITKANSHPQFDCTGNIALVHNGIIENYYLLKKELTQRKHKIVSDTDTELVAHLIEEKVEKGMTIEEAVRQVFRRLKGYNALVVMDKMQKRLLAVKTGSPLILGLSKKANYIASDINALGEAEELIILLDGELAEISENGVRVINVSDGREIPKQRIKMVEIEKESEMGEYQSFLEKEINEQPQVLERIVQEDGVQIKKIITLAKKMDKVILVGCGTSYFAGLVATEKLIKKLGKWVITVLASEFDTYVNLLDEKTLIIVLTQSGETIDVLDAIIKAKQKGATITSVVNAPYSSVQRVSDVCQMLSCGMEKCVASTKSFVAQMAVFDIALGIDLNQRIKNIKWILKNKNKINPLAKMISQKQHLFILGRGKMLPIALEGALKIKELSYIHAEGMAGGELKHGTLALIDKDSICIVLVSKENTNEMLASGLEVKARGATVIGIAQRKENVFDEFLPIRGKEDDEQTEAVVWLQLLAEKICDLKRLDPDKPRNLAKSVTVK
ncbi:MAG: Glucosamine/fructose-6-phosphate aminotransferase, isomerizing [Candidatus Collierbacteria bacterium GW2011_GWA2_42_17]|uniref:Glutamine--fructose-6-phosphate aminotransferase [isomerizing] n=1 Tax=Candidatus Collierbacteria bacterium GW2011_GWA2_42_17 TaxID=1618378 RepID=A0A0G0Z1U9_9BACT|nr:MAG: Glucosamine/fructose-6-phosphate aminotransferase, isomerizing [Candidatus Collierbacteria bacterium GW2011_GWB2_42_12]KKS42734.1 MAG: Glucosamine/fructose-6-phosphate aminotransferase, isomerizing [Candidatus Collierbacteria bacterium GW2011_GWA2_42_17]